MMHFNLIWSHSQTGMMFMQKITGLSSEISDMRCKNYLLKDGKISNISIYDCFCYCFNFLGVLSGPYYTFKTYQDHLHLPFSKGSMASRILIKYVTIIVISSVVSLTSGLIWPMEYAMTSEFLNHRSFFYKIFYMFPLFLEFRTRVYAVNKFGELIFIRSGLGVYPKVLQPKCGHGPTREISEQILQDGETLEMDYETINGVNIFGFETCITFREAVKDHWNKCVQYWLYRTVYSRFPHKKYRLFVTQLISSYWHGPRSGYFFCLLMIVIYVPIENIFDKLETTSMSKTRKITRNALQFIMKTFMLQYMSVAFVMKDFDKFWLFYGSIYHFGYFLVAVMSVGYFSINKKVNKDNWISCTDDFTWSSTTLQQRHEWRKSPRNEEPLTDNRPWTLMRSHEK